MRSPRNRIAPVLLCAVAFLALAGPSGAYPLRRYAGGRHAGWARRAAPRWGVRPHYRPAAAPRPTAPKPAAAKPAVVAKPIAKAVTMSTPAPAKVAVSAAPAIHPAAKAPPAAAKPPRAIPDYGGRDSAIGTALDASGAAAPLNPLAQAGRALEALVIVLALVAGGLYLLKRSGLMKTDAKGRDSMPASLTSLLPRSPGTRPGASAQGTSSTQMLTVLGSQTLPDGLGTVLHVVSVGGRTLLLGATAQSVTLLTELESIPASPHERTETPEEATAFADYLTRVGVTSETAPVPINRTNQDTLSAAADRLQSLLERRREEATH